MHAPSLWRFTLAAVELSNEAEGQSVRVWQHSAWHFTSQASYLLPDSSVLHHVRPSNQCHHCRFTLAGLELSDKAEAQRAQALVRRHGGRRFTSQTLHLLQGVDKSNILALCPCSLTKQKVAQLQSWGDFTSGWYSHDCVLLCFCDSSFLSQYSCCSCCFS